MARRRRPNAEVPTGATPAAGRAGRTREPVPPAELIETHAEDWLRPGEQAPPTPPGDPEPQSWAWAHLASAVRSRQSRARGQWAAEHGLTWRQMCQQHRRAWSAVRWRTAWPVISRAPNPRQPAVPEPPAAAVARMDVTVPNRPRPPRAPAPAAAPRSYRAVGWHPGHGWHAE